MRKVTAFFVFMAVVLAFAACSSENAHKGRIPLAAVDGSYLYEDEVELMYAIYGQGHDSASFRKNYVEHWAVERLFYKKASENVAATSDIDKMVESYKQGLILNIYQDRLIEQQLIPDIKDDDIISFYNANKGLFELDEPMLKGLLLKVPDKSQGINKVRVWCVRRNLEDLESLEKYSISNSSVYESFFDEWRSVGEVARQTPITEYQLNERLKKKETIEFRQDGYTYFVSADTLLQKGDTKPIEMVSAEIIDLLVNSKRVSFINEMKNTLYNDALVNGEVVVY